MSSIARSLLDWLPPYEVTHADDYVRLSISLTGPPETNCETGAAVGALHIYVYKKQPAVSYVHRRHFDEGGIRTTTIRMEGDLVVIRQEDLFASGLVDAKPLYTISNPDSLPGGPESLKQIQHIFEGLPNALRRLADLVEFDFVNLLPSRDAQLLRAFAEKIETIFDLDEPEGPASIHQSTKLEKR